MGLGIRKKVKISSKQEILKQYWGYDDFRGLQANAIDSVLSGRDTLILFPTGAGKSICFQVPALMLPGTTIVVSPLIALMNDQVMALRALDIEARVLHSGLRRAEKENTFGLLRMKRLKLLYVSPERLQSKSFQDICAMAEISLIAIDEAHCISQWGHDFRPEYLKITTFTSLNRKVPIVALTASATESVRKDIKESLELRSPGVFESSHLRENLSFVVMDTNRRKQQLNRIVKLINGTGIVYVSTRVGAETIASYLQNKGESANFFHAGMDPVDKRTLQDKWLLNKTRIIVATNAFGMGIDKDDVRFVVHYEMPTSMEAYYQEAGRGGRDGKESFAILLHDKGEADKRDEMAHLQFPDRDLLEDLFQRVSTFLKVSRDEGYEKSFEYNHIEFCRGQSLRAKSTFFALQALEKAGVWKLSDGLASPSQLYLIGNVETIKDYVSQFPKFSSAFDYIVRTYEGIFSAMVMIDEKQIAKATKSDDVEVGKILNKWHQDGVVKYNPRYQGSRIKYLINRPSRGFTVVPQKLYSTLKERFYTRLDSMKSYVNGMYCRQRIILEYFGERLQLDCGKCDVCRGSLSSDINDDFRRKYEVHLAVLLSSQSQSIESLLEKFTYNKRKRIVTLIKEMEDSGRLAIKNGELTINE